MTADLSYARGVTRGDRAALLQNEGSAVARGLNDEGQCDIPALVVDLSYTQLLLVGSQGCSGAMAPS